MNSATSVPGIDYPAGDQFGTGREKVWNMLVKVMSVLVGACLIIICVLQFWDVTNVTKETFNGFIVAFWLFFNGIFIIVFEAFAIIPIRILRGTYYTYLGRGMIWFFLGTLGLGLASHNDIPFGLTIILGLGVVAAGSFLIVMSWPCRGTIGPRPMYYYGESSGDSIN
eukprot:TRINITY_DN5717_c0_g1_i1.p1 TRINITY_DN5717_c0_g1~~TRINITY_DN5717_c0_g1_i1.p1  ORF type:complete len:168 (-),score=12.73 TRINITY_DN5717_c0_g1_i1:127-630(-)